MERLTAEDAIMLWADARWPQEIGAVVILDGRPLLDPGGRFRIERVRAVVAARLHLVPRFRQLLRVPPAPLGGPLWTDAPRFDLAEHVRVAPLPADADEAELLRTVEQLRRHRLDRSRPLWEMWFLPGLPEQRVGLFVRMHHTVADGIAGVAAIGAFLDPVAEVPVGPAAPWTPAPAPSARDLRADVRRRRRDGARHLVGAVARPADLARGARAVAASVRDLLAEEVFSPNPSAVTSLDRVVGPARRLALLRADLDEVRQIAGRQRATVNDVLLALTAAGVRGLLAARGELTDDLIVRITVPVTLRPARTRRDARGNLIGQMLVPLPVGTADPVERLSLIAAATRHRKAQSHPPVGAMLRSRLARRAMIELMRRRPVNVMSADVPGPEDELYLAGARLLEVFPVIPLVANVPLGVGALSYAGRLGVAVIADRDAVPDLDVLVAAMERELATLAGAPPRPAPTGTGTAPPPRDHSAGPPLDFDLAVAVRRPPQAVFALLADVQDVEPIPRRAGVRMAKSPSGPTTAGTRWDERVRMLPGWWMRVDSVVTEADPPRNLGMDFANLWFSGHLTYTIEPTPTGSVLHQREHLRPRRLLRPLGRPIDVALRRRLLIRLADLRDVLEAGLPEPAS